MSTLPEWRNAAKALGTLTIGTYNILAQGLVRRTMFPYACDKALKRKDRLKLLLTEVRFPSRIPHSNHCCKKRNC